jgi:hypothetical protein
MAALESAMQESIANFTLKAEALRADAAIAKSAADAAAAEAAHALTQRARSVLNSSLAANCKPAPTIAPFRGGAVRVRMDGDVLTLHLNVVSKLSYFTAYLTRWSEDSEHNVTTT